MINNDRTSKFTHIPRDSQRPWQQPARFQLVLTTFCASHINVLFKFHEVLWNKPTFYNIIINFWNKFNLLQYLIYLQIQTGLTSILFYMSITLCLITMVVLIPRNSEISYAWHLLEPLFKHLLFNYTTSPFYVYSLKINTQNDRPASVLELNACSPRVR